MTPGPPHQLNAAPIQCSNWFCCKAALWSAAAIARSASYNGLLMSSSTRRGPPVPRRTAYDLSRLCAGVHAVADYLYPVHQHRTYSTGKLVRFLEGRVVGDGVRIEHEDVGFHSFFEKTAIGN